jgi:hypothetical protein
MAPHRRALHATVVARAELKPDAAGVLQAISRIGYTLREAVADLVDNSVDAGARTVLIRFFRDGDQLRSLALIDDGRGMTAHELEEAMRFGSRTKKTNKDLGKYGMGLKSASLNHARSLTVIARRAGEVSARRWTFESIQADWKLETIDASDAERILDRDWNVLVPKPSGTLILWEDIPRFAATAGSAAQRFGQYSRSFADHLGLHFHRFLEDGRLAIHVDLEDERTAQAGFTRTITPLDPFPDRSGRRGYPATFRAQLPVYGQLNFDGHIWPAKSRDPRYKLGGAVAARQGFYFYRNDRLIQAGGWNGWRHDAEPHASLARVSVDLPPRLDDAFAISVQKSGVDVPPGFLDAVDQARSGNTTMADYIRAAIEVYRSAQRDHDNAQPVIRGGVTRPLGRAIANVLMANGDKPVNVDISWTRLPADCVFWVNGDDNEIRLNESFRRAILGDRRASAGDAPLFKALLFLLLADDVVRTRQSKKARERLDKINAILLRALEDP